MPFKGRVEKLDIFIFLPFLDLCIFYTTTVILCQKNVTEDNNDLSDRCAAYKKQQQKVTKQTGQCLTLLSVCLD